MTNQSHEVLLTTYHTFIYTTDVTEWCSDGKVRKHTIFDLEFQGGVSLGDYQESVPKWVTEKGKRLSIKKMSQTHKEAALAFLKKRLPTYEKEEQIAKAKCFIAAFENSLKEADSGKNLNL